MQRLYQECYHDFTVKHFHEQLQKRHNYVLGYTVTEDRTSVSYQFPEMYRRRVQPEERFVYYRGRRKIGGGTGPYVYFGTSIIGAVYPDLNDPNRLRCDILDYQAFPSPVPFKDENARYRARLMRQSEVI
jgi:hypothetical protein